MRAPPPHLGSSLNRQHSRLLPSASPLASTACARSWCAACRRCFRAPPALALGAPPAVAVVVLRSRSLLVHTGRCVLCVVRGVGLSFVGFLSGVARASACAICSCYAHYLRVVLHRVRHPCLLFRRCAPRL